MIATILGEIRLFAGSKCPRGWAFCDGQLLPVARYNALYSLLGTAYGGDGHQSFALPDLRGRVAVNDGAGDGLMRHQRGQFGGVETVALEPGQMPTHGHDLIGSSDDGTTHQPEGKLAAKSAKPAYSGATPNASFDDRVIAACGGDAAHNNMMPSLAIHHIIAIAGQYPSRN